MRPHVVLSVFDCLKSLPSEQEMGLQRHIFFSQLASEPCFVLMKGGMLVSALSFTGMNNFVQNMLSLLLGRQVTFFYITEGVTEGRHRVISYRTQTQASFTYTQCLQNECVNTVCLAVLSLGTRPSTPSPRKPGISDSQQLTGA